MGRHDGPTGAHVSSRGWPQQWQRWHTLLFLHWPVAAEVLRQVVPERLALDLHEGVAYVGIVAFALERAARVDALGALRLRFLETNVRSYVHADGRDPGVYFFSLDAASRVAVLVARSTFGLPYYPARMRLWRQGAVVAYALQRLAGGRPRFGARYIVGAATGPAAPGTLEYFLVERYLLHVPRRDGLWTGQVHHAPYVLHEARLLACHDELLGAAGVPAPVGSPLVHYARPVDVDVYAPRPRGGPWRHRAGR